MNIRSAELLQNSLQNAAENALRNREMQQTAQLEAQRIGVEQAFRNAMMQHYANIEQKQADTADIQEQRLKNQDDAVEKRYGVQQAMQSLADAQERMTQGLQELSLDTKLTPAQKTQYFQQSIDSQPQYKTQMLQNPMWNALYQGQGDWDAVAAAVNQYRAQGGARADKTNPGDNSAFQNQVNEAVRGIANATAQADSTVPKDPDTGKPSLRVTVDPAQAERMGILAGQLAAAGVSSPIPTAAGLIFGTNATVRPNITGTGSAGSIPFPGATNNGSGPATTTTNSFTLTPGGISQDALANVQNTPGGPPILKSFGLVPDMGNTSVNTNGVPTGRPAIPAGAVEHLKLNPHLAVQFDAKYGQGAAAQVLGGQNGQ